MHLYFRDNFFNAGITEILSSEQEQVGYLDLKSSFGSSLDVYAEDHALLYQGKFRFFSAKWEISDGRGNSYGVLRSRFAFFEKKYTYETYGRGSYDIVSPAFSREYEVFDAYGSCVARFERVNGWFSSSAFHLWNDSDSLDTYELVAVIMGVNAIQAASRNNGANTV